MWITASVRCAVSSASSNRTLLRQRTLDGNRHSRRVDAGTLDGALQLRLVRGEIREQVHVEVEGDDHGQVFGAQEALEEARGDLLFGGQHALLAAAGVNQQAQGDGQGGLAREESDLLFLAVLEDAEIVLGEVRNNALVFVAHGDEQVDQLDLDADGLLRFLRGRGRFGLRGFELRLGGGESRQCEAGSQYHYEQHQTKCPEVHCTIAFVLTSRRLRCKNGAQR